MPTKAKTAIGYCACGNRSAVVRANEYVCARCLRLEGEALAETHAALRERRTNYPAGSRAKWQTTGGMKVHALPLWHQLDRDLETRLLLKELTI